MRALDVLGALGARGINYQALPREGEWGADCPSCGLPGGLLVRETERLESTFMPVCGGREEPAVSLVCGSGRCPEAMIERCLPKPPRKRLRLWKALAGDELDSLRRIPSLEYVERLTGREANSRGYVQCPFHAGGRERHPSMHLNEDSSGFYCFACSEGGGLFAFYARLHGLRVPGGGREFARFVGLVGDALRSVPGVC